MNPNIMLLCRYKWWCFYCRHSSKWSRRFDCGNVILHHVSHRLLDWIYFSIFR